VLPVRTAPGLRLLVGGALDRAGEGRCPPLQVLLHVLNLLLRLAGRLRSRPLLGSHGARDGFHQFMRHME